MALCRGVALRRRRGMAAFAPVPCGRRGAWTVERPGQDELCWFLRWRRFDLLPIDVKLLPRCLSIVFTVI